MNKSYENNAPEATQLSDKQLAQLYQQRKQSIIAPTISLSTDESTDGSNHVAPIKPIRSLTQTVAILLFGSAASFGILAVISQLVREPEASYENEVIGHTVIIAQPKVKELSSIDAIPLPPLPPKPSITAPKISQTAKVERYTSTEVMVPKLQLTLPTNELNARIDIPEVAIVPVYKVMPKYPLTALRAKVSGAVALRYIISAEGKVIDIENVIAITGKTNKQLQKAAKQALIQWRFPAEQTMSQPQEIIFEFRLEK